MKKFNLSLVAILAMSTFAIAGGDIAPVEPVVETPMVIEEDTSAFYLGLGYGLVNYDLTVNGTLGDEDINTVMFQAGYEFNQYVAVEARYWLGYDDIGDVAGDYDTWGIYVKPQYPVSEAFNVYALLGYASTSVEPDHGGVAYLDTDAFSWGIGAEYKFTENVSIFLDYVSLGDSDENFDVNNIALPDGTVDVDIQSVNFGVTYRF